MDNNFGGDVQNQGGSLRHLINRDWGGARTFIIRRRMGENWAEVARFHESREAANWVDEAVARNDGSPDDYSVEVTPTGFLARNRWVAWTVAAVAAAILGAIVIWVLPYAW